MAEARLEAQEVLVSTSLRVLISVEPLCKIVVQHNTIKTLVRDPIPAMAAKSEDRPAWALPTETPTRNLLHKVRRRSVLQAPPLPAEQTAAPNKPGHVSSSNKGIRPASTSTGLTWGAAKKLEDEFEAQEMVRSSSLPNAIHRWQADLVRCADLMPPPDLEGPPARVSGKQSYSCVPSILTQACLSCSNEIKTIEVEHLRRQMRTVSEFLTKQYGSDWETVVFGSDAAIGTSQKAVNKAVAGNLDTVHSNPSHIARVLAGTRGGTGPVGSPLKGSVAVPIDDTSAWASDASFVSAHGDQRTLSSEATDVLPDRVLSALPLQSASESRVPDEAELTSRQPLSDVMGNHGGAAKAANSERAGSAPAGGQKDDIASLLGAVQLNSSSPTKPNSRGVGASGVHTANIAGALQATISQKQARAILTQLDATRLLIQGFARRNAHRDEELREMEQRATLQAHQGRELLSEKAAAAVTDP